MTRAVGERRGLALLIGAALSIGGACGASRSTADAASGNSCGRIAGGHGGARADAAGGGPVSFASKVTYKADANPHAVALGDLNGDGAPDVAVANEGASNLSVLLNAGGGSLATGVNYPIGVNPWSIAIGDLNGDSALDLVAVNRGDGTVSVLLNHDQCGFDAATSFPVGTHPTSVAIGDLDGDGALDLAVTLDGDSGPGAVVVLRNLGRGTFSPPVSYPVGAYAESVAIGDVSGDGKLDIVVADSGDGDPGNASVLTNRGDGTFAPPVDSPAGSGPSAVAVGDLNGDRAPDLALTNGFGNDASVLLGSGGGNFATAVSYDLGVHPFSVALGDLNGDGHTDIATALNDEGGVVAVLLNNGDGTMAPTAYFSAGPDATSIAIGDLDGDGSADLLVASEGLSNGVGGGVTVFLNTPR